MPNPHAPPARARAAGARGRACCVRAAARAGARPRGLARRPPRRPPERRASGSPRAATPRRATSSATPSPTSAATPTARASWARAARRWPSGAQGDLLDAYAAIDRADAAAVGRRGPAAPARDRRGGARPAARRAAARAARHRLPDGLRRPGRRRARARGVLRLSGHALRFPDVPAAAPGDVLGRPGDGHPRRALDLPDPARVVLRRAPLLRHAAQPRDRAQHPLQPAADAGRARGSSSAAATRRSPSATSTGSPQAGRDLYPAIMAIMRWGDEHLCRGGPPVELRHSLRRDAPTPCWCAGTATSRCTRTTSRRSPGAGRAASELAFPGVQNTHSGAVGRGDPQGRRRTSPCRASASPSPSSAGSGGSRAPRRARTRTSGCSTRDLAQRIAAAGRRDRRGPATTTSSRSTSSRPARAPRRT